MFTYNAATIHVACLARILARFSSDDKGPFKTSGVFRVGMFWSNAENNQKIPSLHKATVGLWTKCNDKINVNTNARLQTSHVQRILSTLHAFLHTIQKRHMMTQFRNTTFTEKDDICLNIHWFFDFVLLHPYAPSTTMSSSNVWFFWRNQRLDQTFD